MPQLTQRDAENLSPGQATAVVHVIDLQARWDVLLAAKGQQTSDLRARQRANDAYQAALRDYSATYRITRIPEPTQAMPDRLAIWCRVLRVVFGKAESGSSVEVMAKVYRLADRIAARMQKDLVARTPATDLAGAVRELDAVVAWCEALVPPTPRLKLKKDEAA